MSKPLACLALLLLLAADAADASGRLYLTTPAFEIGLAPGGTTTVSLHIWNVDAVTSDPTTITISGDRSGYTYTTASGACGPTTALPSGTSATFDVGALPAGAAFDCTFDITRAADEIDNQLVSFRAALLYSADVDILVGTFADITLRHELVSHSIDADGAVHGVFRLIARNVGNVPVDEFDTMTCYHTSRVSVALPGGCAPTHSFCRDFLPRPAPGARMPAVVPGSEVSCLVEVIGPPGVTPFVPLELDDQVFSDVWLHDTTTGGRVYDPDGASTVLSIGGGAGGGVVAPLPAASALSSLVLGLGVAIMAFVAVRRRAMAR
jgi:hypothetical protein